MLGPPSVLKPAWTPWRPLGVQLLSLICFMALCVCEHPSSVSLISPYNDNKLTWAWWILHYFTTIIVSAPLSPTCDFPPASSLCSHTHRSFHYVCCAMTSNANLSVCWNKGVCVFVLDCCDWFWGDVVFGKLLTWIQAHNLANVFFNGQAIDLLAVLAQSLMGLFH